MGRGDRRSRKGKIAKSSYGNARPHKVKTFVMPVKPVVGASRMQPAAAAPAKLGLARSKK